MNNKYIYTSNWNKVQPKILLNNYYHNDGGLYDQWYISNMENIIKITINIILYCYLNKILV